MSEARIGTVKLLAGSYRGGRADLKVLLTHSIDLNSGAKTLCGRINGDHVCDEFGSTDDERSAPPTCVVCARRDPRFQTASTRGSTNDSSQK